MFKHCVPTFLILTLLVPGLVSCANKAQQGAVVGSLAGAAIGGQVGRSEDRAQNALIGGLIGLAAGYMVGNEWDKYDARKLNNTLESTPSGTTSNWVNPDTGKAYAATPHQAYNNDGRIYRDVTIDSDGKLVKAQAYRDADGQWRLVQ